MALVTGMSMGTMAVTTLAMATMTVAAMMIVTMMIVTMMVAAMLVGITNGAAMACVRVRGVRAVGMRHDSGTSAGEGAIGKEPALRGAAVIGGTGR